MKMNLWAGSVAQWWSACAACSRPWVQPLELQQQRQNSWSLFLVFVILFSFKEESSVVWGGSFYQQD